MSNILIQNIKGLVLSHDRKVSGSLMNDLPIIENAFLLIEGEEIKDFGVMKDTPTRAERIIDATGKFVFPAWCDSHTHLVFAGSREGEFADRISGLSTKKLQSEEAEF